jgi:hypothetical protein
MIEILFDNDFDARGEWEAKQRGLLDNVRVRLSNEKIYTVRFFTPDRLALETKLSLRDSMHDSYNGLILVREVTRSAMQIAVDALAETNFFQDLMPDV